MTLKKVCANCMMVAGAVSALSGAVKSTIEIFPASCAMKAEAPAPVPPPPPQIAAPSNDDSRHRTLDSYPEAPPLLYRIDAPVRRTAIWVWPILLIVGIFLMAFARRLKKGDVE